MVFKKDKKKWEIAWFDLMQITSSCSVASQDSALEATREKLKWTKLAKEC